MSFSSGEDAAEARADADDGDEALGRRGPRRRGAAPAERSRSHLRAALRVASQVAAAGPDRDRAPAVDVAHHDERPR